MIEDNTNRLLMSDSLRGQVPELEAESTAIQEESFIIVGLELYVSGSPRVFAGTAVGISNEDSVIKLDAKVNISEAYDVFTLCATENVECKNCYVTHGERVLTLSGPYKLSAPKMVDFDRQTKMCTLGIDLIKL